METLKASSTCIGVLKLLASRSSEARTANTSADIITRNVAGFPRILHVELKNTSVSDANLRIRGWAKGMVRGRDGLVEGKYYR